MKTFKQWCETIRVKKTPIDHLQLTPEHEIELQEIIKKAKIRHEKARKAAKNRGRHDFPDLPYEASAAYEKEFQSSKGSQYHAPRHQ